MNPAHLHLLLNHVPAIGLGFGVLVLLWGLARRSCEIVRTSFLLFALSALVAVGAYLTGEPAENAIRNVPNFSESLVEPHQEAATIALVLVIIAGVAALVAYYLLARRRECPASAMLTVLIIALVALVFLVRTAQLGGRISHPELRAGYVLPEGGDPDRD